MQKTTALIATALLTGCTSDADMATYSNSGLMQYSVRKH